jgi:hypothetical protein
MAKTLQSKKKRIEDIDEIMMLIDIVRELDEIEDLAGMGFTMKLKVLNKVDELLDKL